MELWVVDRQGRLRGDHEIPDGREGVEPEFVGPLVEVKTTPHDTERGLRREFQRRLREAMRAAAAEEKLLVPLGTPLTTARPDARDRRGELFEAIYGDGVVSAKNCAGTHVHFERENVARQLNLLTALDPALALVSTSPYYRGDRSMDSSRAFAYRTECGSEFREYCGLWEYVDTADEWSERVEAAFEEFVSLAEDRGVPAVDVREQFSPEDTVLNPVRLRECQPTVEWRAPDTALPTQVVRLATDVERLVARTAEQPLQRGDAGVGSEAIGIPEFDRLKRLSRDAIGRGLSSDRVREYLASMGFDVGTYEPLSPRFRGPPTIDEPAARELRLRAAALLRADVAALVPGEEAEPTVPDPRPVAPELPTTD